MRFKLESFQIIETLFFTLKELHILLVAQPLNFISPFFQ